jgi:hypothetical protein
MRLLFKTFQMPWLQTKELFHCLIFKADFFIVINLINLFKLKMNYYKEIFLDFENNCKITPEIYNLFSADTKSDINNKEDDACKNRNKKGLTLSFDYYIVHW